MALVCIFHGIQGHPEENWFPWLKTELQKAGHRVVIPAFPCSDHPNLEEWLACFSQCRINLDDHSILIGHSLGSAFALRLLERCRQPVHATVLIAPAWNVMGNAFDSLMTSFTAATYDWKTIRKYAGEIHVIGSDDDPYIAPEKTEALARNLGVKVTLIKKGGHFNAAAGYTTFQRLLDEMGRLR
ncbi:MAG: alpha/beta fold hydrolase [Candidatus Peribacteraceae bacterium]|nr:alpha/beta fold hydrolase [Candidatus Peribacteraceae bacterium]MDD5742251.1 alpha/beta fold hydrolase [Candidatus Peribacteraceae bacterium]